jgi:hypothetical protein
MTVRRPAQAGAGRIILKGPGGEFGTEALTLLYNRAQVEPVIGTIPLTDAHLRDVWGTTVFRIVLKVKKASARGDYSFVL